MIVETLPTGGVAGIDAVIAESDDPTALVVAAGDSVTVVVVVRVVATVASMNTRPTTTYTIPKHIPSIANPPHT